MNHRCTNCLILFMLMNMPVTAQTIVQPVNYAVCKTPGRLAVAGKIKNPFAQFEKKPFLSVHGNIQYDFLYRSFTDTPFTQRNFAQHSVQATLDISIRDQYPFRITLSTRRSNSPYFDNITDVNLQFSQATFINNIKNRLGKKLPGIYNNYHISELERLYELKKDEVGRLQAWINKPDRLQEAIELKEAALRRKMGVEDGAAANVHSINNIPGMEKTGGLTDSLLNKKDRSLSGIAARTDSLNGTTEKYSSQKEKLHKAIGELKEYGQKLFALRKAVQDSAGKLKQQLAQITGPGRLKEFIRENKLDEQDLPKGWKTLSAINIGIGRTWVDYSELTVKNISLTGINAEFNPSKLYLAAAAGKVNYRFRDFVVKNNDQPEQSLYLLRAGIGKKEGNNLILTWYDGKKSILNYYTGFPITNKLERVSGFSIQSRLQLDVNNYIVLESAKSSFGNINTTARPMEKILRFNDRSNEAYSIKIYSYHPKHNTKINGYYRKMGEHFQSFTLQPINVEQEAYQFGIQQSFLKRRLTVDAGIRKNDFSNPLINPGINSKTVFKSLQLALRVPEYPFVSVGYYPSSQLTVLDNNIIAENQYNTLSAIASHAWRAKKAGMSANLVFLKFYNDGADTGFIYYNASSFAVNQFLFLKNMQLQSGLTVTSQQQLKVITLEQSLGITAKEWLSFNGALKYNRVNNGQTLWGGTLGLGIHIKHIGSIQAVYDKSYLPGTNRNLLPVDMGRITWYRAF